MKQEVVIPQSLSVAFIQIDRWIGDGEKDFLYRNSLSPKVSPLEYLNKYYWNFYRYTYAEGDIIRYSRMAGKPLSATSGKQIFCCLAYQKNINETPLDTNFIYHFWLAVHIRDGEILLLEKIELVSTEFKNMHNMIKHHIKDSEVEQNYETRPGINRMYSLQCEISFLTNIRNLKVEMQQINKAAQQAISHYMQLRQVVYNQISSLSYLTEARHYFLEPNNHINEITQRIKDNLNSVWGDNYVNFVGVERLNRMIGMKVLRLILSAFGKDLYSTMICIVCGSNYELSCGLEPILKKYSNYTYYREEIDKELEYGLAIESQKEIIDKQIKLLTKQKRGLERKTSYDNSFVEHFIKPNIYEIKEEAEPNIGGSKEEKIRNEIYRPESWKAEIEKIKNEIEQAHKGTPEYSTKSQILEYILKLPHRSSKTKVDYKTVRGAMDETHFSHDKLKQEISEYIYEIISSTDRQQKTLCLVGPPGTGKSTIVKTIAKVLGRRMFRVSMGGVDHKYMVGHSPTYINSKPGIIIENMSRLPWNNPVILMDEIDKMPIRDSPFGVLIEFLDPILSKNFKDHYIGLEYDMSKALIICTANDINAIDSALLSRMTIVEIDSYTLSEKCHIVENHIWPKLNKKYDVDINISKNLVAKLIDEYTYEGGVRDLHSILNKLMIRTLQLAEKNETEVSEIKNLSVLNDLDKKSTFWSISDSLERYSSSNTMIGMAVNSALQLGFPIQINMKVETSDDIGGEQLLVNTEDAPTKLSATISYQYIKTFFERNYKFYISFNPISMPCSGSSAGLALAIGFYKAAFQLRGIYSATGECDLNGYIGSIGGVDKKILGAEKAGIEHIFIPKINESDYNKVKKILNKKTKVYLITNFNEVIPILNEIHKKYEI